MKKSKFIVLELMLVSDGRSWQEELNKYPDYHLAAAHPLGDYYVVILERQG